MLSTITESTELRPLSADEIDSVSGGATQSVHAHNSSTGTVLISLVPGVSGTLSASATGGGTAMASVSSNGTGNISVTSDTTVVNGGTASTTVVAYST